MLRASLLLLLLLGLLLHVQPGSSAPISAEGVQSSAVGGPAELEPDEGYVPAVPAEVVPPPDETPGETAILIPEKDPELAALSRPSATTEAPTDYDYDAGEEASQVLNVGTDSADREPLELDDVDVTPVLETQHLIYVEISEDEISQNGSRAMAGVKSEGTDPVDSGSVILPDEEASVDAEGFAENKSEEQLLISDTAEPQPEDRDQSAPDVEKATGPDKSVSVVPGDSGEQVLPSQEEETFATGSSEEVEISQELLKEEKETLIPVETEDDTEKNPTSDPEEELPPIVVPVEAAEEAQLMGPDGEEGTPHKSSQKISAEIELVIEKQELILVSGSDENPEKHAKEGEAFVRSVVEEESAVDKDRLLGTTEKEESVVLHPAEPGNIAPLDSSELANRETPPSTQEEQEESLLLVTADDEGASEMTTNSLTAFLGNANEKSTPEDSGLQHPAKHEENQAAEDLQEDRNKEAETGPQPESGPFKASGSAVHNEPAAPVKRGVILGAALLTLMSFIITGFVGMTISKKLRGKKRGFS